MKEARLSGGVVARPRRLRPGRAPLRGGGRLETDASQLGKLTANKRHRHTRTHTENITLKKIKNRK